MTIPDASSVGDMLKELNMSKEESDRLADAFTKPEFRKLFEGMSSKLGFSCGISLV
jgi:hypothetical protein